MSSSKRNVFIDKGLFINYIMDNLYCDGELVTAVVGMVIIRN